MDRYYKGCALDAYELFGAHLCEERGKKEFASRCMHRMRKAFRSSAPLMTGAARDTRVRRKDDKGIWSLFVAEAKEGDMYKYRVTQATGRIVDKMDPYAFYPSCVPIRPASLQIWIIRNGAMRNGLRSVRKILDKPVNIYRNASGLLEKG